MAASEAMQQLSRFGLSDGPSTEQALELLTRVRLTPEQGPALQQLLTAHRRMALPEPLLVAVASALVDRGESHAAEQALADATSNAALVLRADLLASAGEIPRAASLIERVLLQDIDWPGALERHARWRPPPSSRSPPVRTPSAAAESAFAAPTQSPFRLIREVGRGGSAAVYEAEDPDLGRRIALKVYHRADRDRAQLQHEARVASALAGEGIVPVFDVDLDSGWLAMKLATLGALRDRLARKDESVVAQMGEWASSLARAIARVHALGWVHNDIKPANILFRTRHSALLSDFGTARRLGEQAPAGSLGYASADRTRGGTRASIPLDDVYGFGRIVEDVLAAFPRHEEGDKRGALENWRTLAAACVGPESARPKDGAILVAKIDTELLDA